MAPRRAGQLSVLRFEEGLGVLFDGRHAVLARSNAGEGRAPRSARRPVTTAPPARLMRL
jgi:hypothetical protein